MGMLEDLTNELMKDSQVFHGMDLGTYSSLWAYKRKGGSAKTVDYSGNNRGGIPSLFWRSPSGIEYVADEVLANNGLVEDPMGVCSSVKMKLKEKSIHLHDTDYSPQEILKRIIKHIIDVSTSDLQKELVDISFDGLIVGVPALFTAAEKGTILSALEEVTGCKKIRLVPEPILAAISCNIHSSTKTKPTLIYDLGAGTFDVCVLLPNPNQSIKNPYPFLVKEPNGLLIAGDVFDERMLNLIISKLEQNPYSLNLNNLRNVNHADYRLLRISAREIKEALSNQDSVKKSIVDSGLGMGIVVVEKAEYEGVLRSDIQKTVDLAYDTLMKCNLGAKPDIDIILVGGSSNIPLVRKMIEQRFDWIDPNCIVQRLPEKAVALGAAIFAELPSVVDNTPVPFAYAVDTFASHLNRDMLRVIIPKGAQLPITTETTYSPLHDNQEALRFNIYEVYSSDEKDYFELNEGTKTKYSFTHRFGKKVSDKTEVELSATLTADGVLEVTTNDFGVSNNSIQKKRIEFEEQ